MDQQREVPVSTISTCTAKPLTSNPRCRRASCTSDRGGKVVPREALPGPGRPLPHSSPTPSHSRAIRFCLLLSASLPASLPGEARPATPLEGAPWLGEGSQVAAQSQDGGDLAPKGGRSNATVPCLSAALIILLGTIRCCTRGMSFVLTPRVVLSFRCYLASSPFSWVGRSFRQQDPRASICS